MILARFSSCSSCMFIPLSRLSVLETDTNELPKSSTPFEIDESILVKIAYKKPIMRITPRITNKYGRIAENTLAATEATFCFAALLAFSVAFFATFPATFPTCFAACTALSFSRFSMSLISSSLLLFSGPIIFS